MNTDADVKSGSLTKPDSSIRWAAGAFTVCFTVFTLTLILYATLYGSPSGTGPGGEVTIADKAGHLLAKWDLISTLWLVEALCWMLVTVAGFVLQNRDASGPTWFPSRIAWITFALGGAIQVLMYPIMLGAYPAAAAAVAEHAVLMDSLNNMALVIFYLSNVAVYGGLAGVYLAETGAAGVIPRPLALVGAVGSFIVVTLMLGLLTGVIDNFMLAAPAALAIHFINIYLGMSLWRQA